MAVSLSRTRTHAYRHTHTSDLAAVLLSVVSCLLVTFHLRQTTAVFGPMLQASAPLLHHRNQKDQTCSAMDALSRSFFVVEGVCEVSGRLSSSSSSSSLLRLEPAQTRDTFRTCWWAPTISSGQLTWTDQRGRGGRSLRLHTEACLLIGCLLLRGLDEGCGLSAAWMTDQCAQTGSGGQDSSWANESCRDITRLM